MLALRRGGGVVSGEGFEKGDESLHFGVAQVKLIQPHSVFSAIVKVEHFFQRLMERALVPKKCLFCG